jgi:hypothetical protein
LTARQALRDGPARIMRSERGDSYSRTGCIGIGPSYRTLPIALTTLCRIGKGTVAGRSAAHQGWSSALELSLATHSCHLPTYETSMTSRNFLISLAVLALTLPMPRSSHGHELMEADWCSLSNQEIQIVSTFNFDKDEILKLLISNGPTHGVVDRYLDVSGAINNYCGADVVRILGPGNHNLRAIVTGPENYLNPDHHQFYDEDAGLIGGCAVCVPRAPTNPDPRRPHLSADPEAQP